jgi:hypothetical protein
LDSWLAVWLVTVLCSAVQARGQVDERVRAWVESLINIETIESKFANLRIDYRLELHDVPPAEEIAAMRQRVVGFPQHPDRAELERIDTVLRGEAWFQGSIWYDGKSGFRSSQDSGHGLPYFEMGASPKAVWGFGPESANFADPAAASPTYNYRFAIDMTRVELRDLLSGVLSQTAGRTVSFRSASASADTWTATFDAAVGDATNRSIVRGRWADDPRLRTVEERLVLRVLPDGETPILRIRCGPWSFSPVLGCLVTDSVSHFDPVRNTLQRRVIFRGAERVEPEFVASLLEPPQFDGTDPIRGKLEFKWINDDRGAAPKSEVRQPDGSLKTVHFHESPEAQNESRLRLFGWVALVCVSLVFLAVLFARRGWVRS